jgi:hypothetical protein
MDSTPGKLGSGQKGVDKPSPQEQAMIDKKINDGIFVESIHNEYLFKKLYNLGIISDPSLKVRFLNNEEEEEVQRKDDENNLAVSQIALTMSQAGLKMSAEYFTERTGIPCEEISEPEPEPNTDPSIKDTLNKLYS